MLGVDMEGLTTRRPRRQSRFVGDARGHFAHCSPPPAAHDRSGTSCAHGMRELTTNTCKPEERRWIVWMVAAELVCQAIETGEPAPHILLPVELAVRESTGGS